MCDCECPRPGSSCGPGFTQTCPTNADGSCPSDYYPMCPEAAGRDGRPVVEEEVAVNKEQDQRQKEEILRLKQLAQEKEKQDALRRERHEQQKKEVEERIVGKQLRVKGKVEQWKGTYGFIRSKGKAGKLGRIFFHRSSVIGHETRRFFKTGTELEYEVINGKHPGTFQAMQINVLPRPGRNPAGDTGTENQGVSSSS